MGNMGTFRRKDKGRAPAGVWAGALYILPAEHGGRVGGRLFAQRAKRSFVPGTQSNRVELFLISAQDPAGLPMDHVEMDGFSRAA
jgi:hypothetical protein